MRNFFLILIAFITISCLKEIRPERPFICGEAFTDPRDGKKYQTVWIANNGSHDLTKPGNCWMAENMKFQTPVSTSCYGDAASNCNTYGNMYGPDPLKTLPPGGWHIATSNEWKAMLEVYGFFQVVSTGEDIPFKGTPSILYSGGNSKLNILKGGAFHQTRGYEGLGNFTFFVTGETSRMKIDDNGVLFPTGASSDNNNYTRGYIRCIKN